MVKGKRKPLKQIQDSIKDYNKVLTVGCGGCVSICLAGGQKEVIALNTELNVTFKLEKIQTRLDAYTVERQCNMNFLAELDKVVEKYDCLMSMACGAGVQLLAERFHHKPVIPAINTMAIGVDRGIGLYEERCRACGECVIGFTGGICPVTRCAKGLFNGPCGGVNNGQCEANKEASCAWVDIYNRLKEQNRLDSILKFQETMLWQNQTQRTIIQEPYEGRYYDKS
ncbi:MAG: methylenetetrahydrofolate reductase C-terminal domain-containing protein [Deltaproteobacteria bacterium]|nr:methylenetetrahydrofolate reductase C-terminal domain-containing protein [Deltaproteobacteria bacterium]